MMTCGVSFLASLANRVKCEDCTQGTPLLLARHHPQLLVIALADLRTPVFRQLAVHSRYGKHIAATLRLAARLTSLQKAIRIRTKKLFGFYATSVRYRTDQFLLTQYGGARAPLFVGGLKVVVI